MHAPATSRIPVELLLREIEGEGRPKRGEEAHVVLDVDFVTDHTVPTL